MLFYCAFYYQDSTHFTSSYGAREILLLTFVLFWLVNKALTCHVIQACREYQLEIAILHT